MIGALEDETQLPPTSGRHIRKRALKNKALTVSFNEKDLRDYVGGFHKRKKKRRKEAEKQQEEALRRKRIEERKKKKMEQASLLFGESPHDLGSESNEYQDELGEEGGEQDASVSGLMSYDNGELKITVRTSEISNEESRGLHEKGQELPVLTSALPNKGQGPRVSTRKSFKKVVTAKHRGKPKKRCKKKCR